MTRPTPDLPKAPDKPSTAGISAQTLADRIDQFLASRGYRPPDGPGVQSAPPPPGPPANTEASTPSGAGAPEVPVDFVCEDDVRAAIKAGRKLVIGEKTIVTPAARDLAESHRVFVQAGWPN